MTPARGKWQDDVGHAYFVFPGLAEHLLGNSVHILVYIEAKLHTALSIASSKYAHYHLDFQAARSMINGLGKRTYRLFRQARKRLPQRQTAAHGTTRYFQRVWVRSQQVNNESRDMPRPSNVAIFRCHCRNDNLIRHDICGAILLRNSFELLPQQYKITS